MVWFAPLNLECAGMTLMRFSPFRGGSGCMDPDLSWRLQRQLSRDHNHVLTLGKLCEQGLTPTQPLVRPAPRSTIIFPLVVLVAVLPGMAALNSWDLTPPGPMWGLRGLAVLDGLVLDQTPAADRIKPIQEATAFRAVACQPPLYAWMEAIALWLSANRNPIGSILPSYLAGVVAVALVYLHGRLWRGTGLGLSVAILVGFNQNLLSRMQEATPTTLALCGVLAALLAYGWYTQVTTESRGSPWWTGPVFWAVVGGLSLSVTLLSLGGLALIVIPIILLHQYYLRGVFPSSSGRTSAGLRWPSRRMNPGFFDGLISLGIALSISIPWYILMFEAHGWKMGAALLFPSHASPSGYPMNLLPRLIKLAPVTLPLGIYGAVRAIRSAIVDEFNTLETVSSTFWVMWLAVAALAPTAWPSGPQNAFDLILLVPLSLLAAQTVADLVNRSASVRILIGLAPATAISIMWWTSDNPSKALAELVRGRADATTALRLHLAFDLVLVSVLGIRAINHWARRRDSRQRCILAIFLLGVLITTVISGLREVLFRHSETHDLLSLRVMILRRNREVPFEILTVVNSTWFPSARDKIDPEADRPLPGGRLRFILRTALPRLPQRDLDTIDELFGLPDGQRLIILAGTEQRLSSADQFKLGMEAIHPGRSGILNAYATVRSRMPRR